MSDHQFDALNRKMLIEIVIGQKAEIERLQALLNAEPVLTDGQREQLTNGFGAILPAEAVFALGWRTALANVRRALEQKP